MPNFALAWADSPTQDVSIPNNPNNPQSPQPGPNNNPAQPGLAPVVQLPAAPAATDVFTAVGRSNVTIPPPAQLAANGQPAQPPPNNAQNVATGTDIDWVTVSFKISLNDLAKEFQRTNIPAQQYPTAMLDVELIRQEQQADGSWGPETACPKLTTSTQPPFPPATASKQERQTYVNWAVGAAPEILQPKFYDVIKGDPWTLPKELVGSGAVGDNGAVLILGPNDVRPGFDPNSAMTQDPNSFVPPLTNKEKQLIYKAKEDKKEQDAASQSKSRSSTPSGPAGGGTRPGGGPEPAGRPGWGGGAGRRGGGLTRRRMAHAHRSPLPRPRRRRHEHWWPTEPIRRRSAAAATAVV